MYMLDEAAALDRGLLNKSEGKMEFDGYYQSNGVRIIFERGGTANDFKLAFGNEDKTI